MEENNASYLRHRNLNIVLLILCGVMFFALLGLENCGVSRKFDFEVKKQEFEQLKKDAEQLTTIHDSMVTLISNQKKVQFIKSDSVVRLEGERKSLIENLEIQKNENRISQNDLNKLKSLNDSIYAEFTRLYFAASKQENDNQIRRASINELADSCKKLIADVAKVKSKLNQAPQSQPDKYTARIVGWRAFGALQENYKHNKVTRFKITLSVKGKINEPKNMSLLLVDPFNKIVPVETNDNHLVLIEGNSQLPSLRITINKEGNQTKDVNVKGLISGKWTLRLYNSEGKFLSDYSITLL